MPSWAPPSAVGVAASSTSLAWSWHLEGFGQQSSSWHGQADRLAWPWLYTGSRCCRPVTFHQTAQEGLLAARLRLEAGGRHWADIAAGGAAATGGNNWADCSCMPRVRWSCANQQSIGP